MIADIPKYPAPPDEKKHDAVAESLKNPNAWAKPGTIGTGKVMVRVNMGKVPKSAKPKKKRRGHDKRDVTFY